jgi:hypothetical protein
MSDDSLQIDKKISPFIPTGQASTSTVGGALSVLFVVIMHGRGYDFPAGVEVSIGVVTTTLCAYMHDFISILFDRLKRS